MSWIGIGISAGVGAVVAVVASPALKHVKSEPLRNFLYLGVFCIALAVAREVIAPWAERHYSTSQVEEELLKNPAMAAMKAYEPQAFEELLVIAKRKIAEGANAAEIQSAAAPVVQSLVTQRLPTSSNAASVQYLKATMDEVRFYFDKGGETCYYALFPDAGHADFLALPPSIRAADFDGLAAVLRDAKISPQPAPSEADFEAALGENGLIGLDRQYVPDLNTIGMPKTGAAARRRACEVLLAIYSELFKLPPNRAGTAIRYMLSQAR